MADDRVSVTVDGRRLETWQSVEINLGLAQGARAFSLGFARDPSRRGRGDANLPFRTGDAVEIRVGDEMLLTGYVNRIAPSRDPERQEIRAVGRSKTGDLIDCGATHKPGQWTGATVGKIARDLARPFGIEVHAAEADPIADFQLQQGEKVHAAIARAATLRGLIVRDDALGDVWIGKPRLGKGEAALIHLNGPDGEPHPDNNVVSSEASFDETGRFSEVIVKAQTAASELQTAVGASAIVGTAKDPGVRRYRPNVVQAEGSMDARHAELRAKWETTRAAGRSLTYTPELVGWRQRAGGALWRPGFVHPVRDAVQGLDIDMLVTEVLLRLDAQRGRTCDLTLQPPEAFAAEPPELAAVKEQKPWDPQRRQFQDEPLGG